MHIGRIRIVSGPEVIREQLLFLTDLDCQPNHDQDESHQRCESGLSQSSPGRGQQ